MLNSFSEVKKAIEVAVIMEANAVPIPHCVEDTGDLIKVGSEFIDAFDSTTDWFMFSVEEELKKKITVGKGASRIYGSIFFTVYCPRGQANVGGAAITDFVYEHFHATTLNNIRLRDARTISKYKLKGWDSKTLQVSFEINVN